MLLCIVRRQWVCSLGCVNHDCERRSLDAALPLGEQYRTFTNSSRQVHCRCTHNGVYIHLYIQASQMRYLLTCIPCMTLLAYCLTAFSIATTPPAWKGRLAESHDHNQYSNDMYSCLSAATSMPLYPTPLPSSGADNNEHYIASSGLGRYSQGLPGQKGALTVFAPGLFARFDQREKR